MGENSRIQWTNHTFNPWVGCQRVSPGCTNCYAEALDRRFGGAVIDAFLASGHGQKVLRWGPKAPRVKTSASNWKQPLRWNKASREAGRRDRVFCASLADVFEDRPELVSWRAELFDLIDSTKNLDWLLLTKRPENLAHMLPWGLDAEEAGGPWSNVWLGTTVEDQQRAEERVPALLRIPAKVRFLSCEPLLERVDLGLAGRLPRTEHPRIDWVIVGGESGNGARPFALDWARDLVRQCRASGAAPFVKQLGANPIMEPGPLTVPLKDSHGGDWDEWPADLRIREFPTKGEAP